jgi:hypothetical protein
MNHQEVHLIPIEPSKLSTLQLRFEDQELSARLGGMLPLQQYFDYVQSQSDYHAWMAVHGDTAVGAALHANKAG